MARAPYNITKAAMAARGKLIDAYHSTADPLTNLQSGLGALQSPGTLGGLAAGVWPVGTQALGIPRPLVPAEGWQLQVSRSCCATIKTMLVATIKRHCRL